MVKVAKDDAWRTGSVEVDVVNGAIELTVNSFVRCASIRMGWRVAVEVQNALSKAIAEAKAQQKSQQGSKNA